MPECNIRTIPAQSPPVEASELEWRQMHLAQMLAIWTANHLAPSA